MWITFNTLTSGLIQAVHKKTAGSHMAFCGNISAPVSVMDLVEVSKDTASLVDYTRKKFFGSRVHFFVSDVISGGLISHLGQLHLALSTNC